MNGCQSRRDVVDLIELALLANGGGHSEWNENVCHCDPSVGFQCEYCAIHSALTAAKRYVECNPPEVIDLVIVDNRNGTAQSAPSVELPERHNLPGLGPVVQNQR